MSFSLIPKNNVDLFDQLFDDFFVPRQTPKTFYNKTFEVETTPEYHLVSVVAPGMSKEDFKVGVEKNTLTVSYDLAKRTNKWINRQGFDRSWMLPENCKPDEITAQYEAGILKVKIPFDTKKKIGYFKSIEVK